MTQILRSMLLMGLTCTVSIVPASLLAAAAAGKVMYAIGEARAIDTSGSPRSVRRGDEFVSGERLVTGEGRMQIRFTDGGLVSLQPRTEFEINDYNYEGKTDGSERGFFSLLRGGVRAVTGFVGRANRDRYRVKTRFATIGIRGTAYKARVCQSDCAKPDGLYASGGEGVIVVFNDGGELELTHGQRLYVRDIAAPPTPTDVDPDVADIPPPAENVEELGPVTATTAAASGGAPLVSSIGDALFQASVAEVSTIRPISRGIITGTGSVTLIGDLDFFELDASESGAFIEGGTVDGAGLATFNGSFNGADGIIGISGSDDKGEATSFFVTTVVEPQTDGILYLGRWTNTTATLFGEGGFSASTTLDGNANVHYIAGIDDIVVPTSGNGTYTFSGLGTSSTDTDGMVGQGIVSGSVMINFAGGPNSVTTDFFVEHGGSIHVLLMGQLDNGPGVGDFQLEGEGLGACPDGSCIFATVEGFLAGPGTPPERVGLGYEIEQSVPERDIVGVGGFNLTP